MKDEIEDGIARLESLCVGSCDMFKELLRTYRMPWCGAAVYVDRDGTCLLSNKAADIVGRDAVAAASSMARVEWGGRVLDAHAVRLADLPGLCAGPLHDLVSDWVRQRLYGNCCTCRRVVPREGCDILVGTLAKLLRQRGEETGQNRLFAWMRNMGYLCRRTGEMYNMPTQDAVARGLFRISLGIVERPDGTTVATRTVRVTPKGVDYFLAMPRGSFSNN